MPKAMQQPERKKTQKLKVPFIGEADSDDEVDIRPPYAGIKGIWYDLSRDNRLLDAAYEQAEEKIAKLCGKPLKKLNILLYPDHTESEQDYAKHSQTVPELQHKSSIIRAKAQLKVRYLIKRQKQKDVKKSLKRRLAQARSREPSILDETRIESREASVLSETIVECSECRGSRESSVLEVSVVE